jgi:hypothetical protein
VDPWAMLTETGKILGAMAGVAVAVVRFVEWHRSKRPRPIFEDLKLRNGELQRAIEQANRDIEMKNVLVNLAGNLHKLELQFNQFRQEIRSALDARDGSI